MDKVYPEGILQAKELIYDTFGFLFENALPEKESSEYDAYTFNLNNLKIVFRSAKVTPTKNGQFVTLWKRQGTGPIMPFDATDNIDLVVVSTKAEKHFGQFVFPKSVLLKKGVFTTHCKDGKRAMRVYPPWDTAENPQAKKTQKWQLDYFLEIDKTKPLDELQVNKLYNLK